MHSPLTWSALILACLAAVAWRQPEAPPACRETRPVYGAGACCQAHRISGGASAALEAADAAWRRGDDPVHLP